MHNPTKQLTINYSAAAILFWIAATTFAAFVGIVVRNILIVNSVSPDLNFWINECSELLTFFILTLLYVKALRKRSLETGKTFLQIFIFLLVFLAVSEALQFFFPLVFDSWSTPHADGYRKYNAWIYRSFFYELVGLVFYTFKYLIVFLVMIRRIPNIQSSETGHVN